MFTRRAKRLMSSIQFVDLPFSQGGSSPLPVEFTRLRIDKAALAKVVAIIVCASEANTRQRAIVTRGRLF